MSEPVHQVHHQHRMGPFRVAAEDALREPKPEVLVPGFVRPVSQGDRALFALSTAGVPIGFVVPRRLGRLGGLLVEVAAVALGVRAIGMIAGGTAPRLRVVPRLLLFAEAGMDALATAAGFWVWVWRPFIRPRLAKRTRTARSRRSQGARHRSLRDTGADRATLVAVALWTLAMVVHTARMAIYISPGRGLRRGSKALQ